MTTSNLNPKNDDKLRYALGKISQAHGGGGYVPSRWVVEATGPENFAVSNRNSGETIAEGIMTHTTASRLAGLLNEGNPVNHRNVVALLQLNLEFESAMRAVAEADEDSEDAEKLINEAVSIQKRIVAL